MEEILKNPYVRSISLKNIKCFGPEQLVSLVGSGNKPAMWTVILGDNGSGKSTILKCLAASLSGPKDIFRYVNDSDYVKVGKKKGVVKLKMYDNDLPKIGNRKSINLQDNLDVEFQRPSLLDFLIPAFGYGSYRRYSNKSFSHAEEYGFSNLFDEDAGLVNAEDWLLRTDYEISKKNINETQLQRVKNVLLELLNNEVEDIEIKKVKNRSSVVFLTRYGWVSINQLSSGYKSLVSWMVDLAARLDLLYPHSENILLERAVVLVDEIDLHLHVSLQRNLSTYLRKTFPNIQFIVTAHSPLMVYSDDQSNILYLEKDESFVRVRHYENNTNDLRVDQILTSDLFGLDSARSNSVENMMERRIELLEKNDLSYPESEELIALNKKVMKIPSYEDAELNEAQSIILEAADYLKNNK